MWSGWPMGATGTASYRGRNACSGPTYSPPRRNCWKRLKELCVHTSLVICAHSEFMQIIIANAIITRQLSKLAPQYPKRNVETNDGTPPAGESGDTNTTWGE